MILGGAQENTLLTLHGLKQRPSCDVHFACGPEISSEGSLLDEVSKLDIPIHIIPHLRRNLHPLDDILAFKELIEYFQQHAFDIVHTHSSKAGTLGRIAARRAGIPLIIHTIHGLAFDTYQSRLRNTIYIAAERIAAQNADVQIAVCKTMAQQALDAGIGKPDATRTIYSGFSLDPFLKVPPREKDGRFVIGLIARMFELKGHEDLMKLAPSLLKQSPHVYLRIVGDGPLQPQWKQWTQRWPQFESRVHFSGKVMPSQVPEELKHMDALLHLSWREGLARTIPQALAACRPVCVYDIGGASEIVQNGQTGWVLAPGDLAGVAQAVEEMQTNPALAQRLAQEGQSQVRALFAVEKMQNEIFETYQKWSSR
jgi:glycosyltransferase involved in cell wall biosynthesis